MSLISEHATVWLSRSLVNGIVAALRNGQDPQNVRNAIRTAESVAPAVLWIDEIDKSFGNGSGSGSDGGTTARVLATLLTWMQEKTAPVFVVATANSVDQLPPELLRRGRLDETFFVDLPDSRERAEIFQIHLTRRSRDPRRFDLSSLANKSEGFSGAEIEQCVIDALFEAYSRRQDLSTELIETACANMIPLSHMMREPIDRLRKWADGRARTASSLNEPAAHDTGLIARN